MVVLRVSTVHVIIANVRTDLDKMAAMEEDVEVEASTRNKNIIQLFKYCSFKSLILFDSCYFIKHNIFII